MTEPRLEDVALWILVMLILAMIVVLEMTVLVK